MKAKTKTKTKAALKGSILLRMPAENDNATRVSRATLKDLSKRLGTTETHVLHMALKRLADEVIPRYEEDEGPLTPEQMEDLRQREPQGRYADAQVCSSLF